MLRNNEKGISIASVNGKEVSIVNKFELLDLRSESSMQDFLLRIYTFAESALNVSNFDNYRDNDPTLRQIERDASQIGLLVNDTPNNDDSYYLAPNPYPLDREDKRIAQKRYGQMIRGEYVLSGEIIRVKDQFMPIGSGEYMDNLVSMQLPQEDMELLPLAPVSPRYDSASDYIFMPPPQKPIKDSYYLVLRKPKTD
jgi:hypothetical protein